MRDRNCLFVTLLIAFVSVLVIPPDAHACDCEFWNEADGALALFAWANGRKCESVPTIGPGLSLAELTFIPVDQDLPANIPDGPAQVGIQRCVEICPFANGSVCGSRTTVIGSAVIPPEGGLLQVSAAITVTQSGPPFQTVSNSRSLTIDEPGAHQYVLSVPASFENDECTERCVLITRSISVSLTVNGGEGTLSLAQEGDAPLVGCQSGDANGDGATNGLDVAAFVDLLITNDPSRSEFCRVDMNADNSVTEDDIPAFIAAAILN